MRAKLNACEVPNIVVTKTQTPCFTSVNVFIRKKKLKESDKS